MAQAGIFRRAPCTCTDSLPSELPLERWLPREASRLALRGARSPANETRNVAAPFAVGDRELGRILQRDVDFFGRLQAVFFERLQLLEQRLHTRLLCTEEQRARPFHPSKG